MPILITWIILILFGILAIYSVSIHESFTLTLKQIANGFREWDPSNYFYFFRQLRNIAIALIAAGIIRKIPLAFFKSHKKVIITFVIIFLLQLMVFVPGIGVELGGARWRIDIPGLPSIQPAEFFKLGYIIFLASRLIRKRKFLNAHKFWLTFIILNAILLAIFVLIPDLGTVLVLGIVGLIMFRYAGAKLIHVVLIFFGGLIAALSLGAIAGTISDRFAYIQKRFTYFISSEVDPQHTEIWRQNQQALIAIGGWGFFWQWYGKGLQKFGYIPEAQSDFIFAAFSEEIGFIGNLVLLALYFYLCYYFLTHLYRIKDPHLKTLWVGIISLIIIQMFVNIGVNLKIMPNTGLTLPLSSSTKY